MPLRVFCASHCNDKVIMEREDDHKSNPHLRAFAIASWLLRTLNHCSCRGRVSEDRCGSGYRRRRSGRNTVSADLASHGVLRWRNATCAAYWLVEHHMGDI